MASAGGEDESIVGLASTGGNEQSSPAVNSSNILAKNERELVPKAMVKPNVLTHVIGNYVIHESDKPFPVNRQRYADESEDTSSEFFFQFFS